MMHTPYSYSAEPVGKAGARFMDAIFQYAHVVPGMVEQGEIQGRIEPNMLQFFSEIIPESALAGLAALFEDLELPLPQQGQFLKDYSRAIIGLNAFGCVVVVAGFPSEPDYHFKLPVLAEFNIESRLYVRIYPGVSMNISEEEMKVCQHAWRVNDGGFSLNEQGVELPLIGLMPHSFPPEAISDIDFSPYYHTDAEHEHTNRVMKEILKRGVPVANFLSDMYSGVSRWKADEGKENSLAAQTLMGLVSEASIPFHQLQACFDDSWAERNAGNPHAIRRFWELCRQETGKGLLCAGWNEVAIDREYLETQKARIGEIRAEEYTDISREQRNQNSEEYRRITRKCGPMGAIQEMQDAASSYEQALEDYRKERAPDATNQHTSMLARVLNDNGVQRVR